MRTGSFAAVVVFAFILTILAGATTASALWSSNPSVNTPVGTAGFSSNPQIAEDGSGGAIIVWEDYRNGSNTKIYAQKMNSQGDALWVANGVEVCTASGHQTSPQVVDDGNGGAVITWQDARSGDHIYAQHISAGGDVTWAPEGVAVCTAGLHQYYPRIVSDYSGGAIITWIDTRLSTSGDIYAQRIDADGNAAWTPDGVAVCTNPNIQGNNVIATDGSGGAIIAWQDNRDSYYGIYAQRIDDEGTPRWTANGKRLSSYSSTNQMSPAIAYDGMTGVVVAWRDGFDPNWNVRAQRVDINGNLLWSGGVTVSGAGSGDMIAPAITDDGSYGAIIAWEDSRNGYLNIYAQRIAANGSVQWTANGVLVSGLNSIAGVYAYPRISGDGSGGAVIIWQGNGSDYDIRAQRVNSGGIAQWTAGGVAVATASGMQAGLQMTAGGGGSVIATWMDGRTSNYGIYAQKVLSNGALPVFAAPAVTIAPVSGISYTAATCGGDVTSDGGLIITARGVCWSTAANPTLSDTCTNDGTGPGTFSSSITGLTQNTLYHVRAYATNAMGTAYSSDQTFATLTMNTPISTRGGQESNTAIVSDGSGGAIIAWMASDIYVQRVDLNGVPKWQINGLALSAGGAKYYPQIVSDGNHGAIVAWQDGSSGNNHIYAQAVDANGNAKWTAGGAAICLAANNQQFPQIATDGAGGAIITWQDSRNGQPDLNYDIYAQRIDANGSVQWTTNGINLSVFPNHDTNPQIAVDGSGGAIITWQGQPGCYGCWGIYAQRINGNGIAQWTTGGIAMTSVGEPVQLNPAIVGDGSGGAIITWEDHRSPLTGSDIFAQRINAAGSLQWATAGVIVSSASNVQLNPQLAGDGNHGAIITWWDFRNGADYLIYAQKVDDSGVPRWTADGVPVCTVSGIDSNYYSPQIISDGSGGAIITWADNRYGAQNNVYAQKVDGNGAAQWTANGLPVSTAPNHQQHPRLAPDGSGGAIITWQDVRSGDWDIYAQVIRPGGALINVVLPVVTTTAISGVTLTAAASGGNVISDGTGAVTARGVCWGTSQNPTLNDSYTTNGSGTGSFISSASSLAHCTLYHLRAYATNAAGTAYGDDVTFTTKCSLTASKDGTGTGNITGTVVGSPGVPVIDCGSTCSAILDSGVSVDLAASPAGSCSYFKQWGGGFCFGNSSPCTVVMSTDRSVAATFDNHLPVLLMRTGGEYSMLTDAYALAEAGDLLKATASTFMGDQTFAGGIQVSLSGGYNCTFTTNAGGFSTIQGRLTVGGAGSGSGSVALENWIIQ